MLPSLVTRFKRDKFHADLPMFKGNGHRSRCYRVIYLHMRTAMAL